MPLCGQGGPCPPPPWPDGTVINVKHANAGEDVHAAIRSACALLAGALELSMDQD